jgi:predicted nucleic acid-binding protein
MRIIVSDASCLIDLEKAELLKAFVDLPYKIAVPDVMLENELLSLTKEQTAFLRRNATIVEVEAKGVERAEEVVAASPALSTYDAFAFVAAEERPGSILLTGDSPLRNVAKAADMEVHGVLWVVEELAHHSKATRRQRLHALELWQQNPQVRLPKAELTRMIAQHRRRRHTRRR